MDSALSVVYKSHQIPETIQPRPEQPSNNSLLLNNCRQHMKHQSTHSSKMVKVTVAGGSNGLGRVIVRAIAATGKHEVSVLSRQVRDMIPTTILSKLQLIVWL